MARRLMNPHLAMCMLLPCILFLSGCVSTEELYAEYDAADCKFVVQQESDGTLSLRELISNTHFPWEPAVYFEFDDAFLSIDSQTKLANSINILKRYPGLNISLQGFADRIGSSDYNKKLAGRRVISVLDYLLDNGIEAERIVSQPLGEGLTQFGDNDKLSRSINRRVELMLLDEVGRPLHPLFDFGDR